MRVRAVFAQACIWKYISGMVVLCAKYSLHPDGYLTLVIWSVEPGRAFWIYGHLCACLTDVYCRWGRKSEGNSLEYSSHGVIAHPDMRFDNVDSSWRIVIARCMDAFVSGQQENAHCIWVTKSHIQPENEIEKSAIRFGILQERRRRKHHTVSHLKQRNHS